ncbi:energy-coupling factor ABC transporter ATP-binding protein [Kosmotoga pacifica]|uniref:energy-coupling factor ABC transporter ATP-binding protein n=1 Tax=Kosmotoga pacifica TaxID=1330330 RepID=UPI00069A66C2|nr:ABC transporter ATP-binding protein [Kosmotoga pacifica]
MCPSSSDIITIIDLKAGYDGAIIFNDFDLVVKRGEYLGVYGFNGSGKSTLLKLIAGFRPPVFYGEVVVDGTVGYVFQNPDSQIIGATVEEDIRFGLENISLDCETVERRLSEILKEFGLESLSSQDTLTLSGGQKQRLTIASIVALKPDVLLFDEPFSMLDRRERRSIMNLINSFKGNGVTVIIASTHLDDLSFCDRVIKLNGGRNLD